jgi:hypothetical protein
MNEPRDEGTEPNEFDLDVQLHPPAGTSAHDTSAAAQGTGLGPSEFGCPSDACQTAADDNSGLPGNCIPSDLRCETEQCTVDCKPLTEDCTSGEQEQCFTLECHTYYCTEDPCATHENCPTREICPTHSECPTEVDCRIK